MSAELATVQPEQASIAVIIREAIASNKSPEYLRELLAVSQTWAEIEARKEFNHSIAEFQRRAPIISKDDKAYDKQYARMDRIWREIRPLLTELGLSVTWQVCELRDATCHVEGQLRRAWRINRSQLLANPNAFATAAQLTSEARSITGRWDVGFDRPETHRDSNCRHISAQWQTNRRGRAVLFVSRSLSNFLATK